jgi:hypothetical protein
MSFDDTIDRSTRPPSDWDSKDLAAASFKGALSNIPLVGDRSARSLVWRSRRHWPDDAMIGSSR